MASTVRIDLDTHLKLKELAQASGESMSSVLEKAVEAYRRQRFLEDANRCYASLREDRNAWQEELNERRAWDVALMDGQTADEDGSGGNNG